MSLLTKYSVIALRALVNSSLLTSPVPLWSSSLKASTVLNSGHSLTNLYLSFSISNSFSEISTNRFCIVVYYLVLYDLFESAARLFPGLAADLSKGGMNCYSMISGDIGYVFP